MLSKTALEKLNIFSDQDLLHHYPSRYEDLTNAVSGTVVSSRNLYTKTGKTIQKIIVKTAAGNQEITWFNQPFLIKTFLPGKKISFSGNNYELITGGELIHTGRLVPVYPETRGVSSKALRRRIYNLLQAVKLQDWLPEKIKNKNHLLNLNSAIQQIHFPKNQAQIHAATKRLSFNELFLLQLEAIERQKAWRRKNLSHKLHLDQEKILSLISSLPFSLTSAQNRCLKEILSDLGKNQPMNRLLQGDVGSGKTVLAAIGMYAAYLNGYQSILMAPTTILVQQHFQTLKTIFSQTDIKIDLITSGKSTGDGDILVGTQALLFKKVSNKIGLLVIDEQHRFGVKQRSQLISKTKIAPHLLTMTATPIPRTIALTFYANLDLSVLNELPPGRKPTKTWVVPPEKRLSAYRWIESQIKTYQSQAFIVCPLIEPSEKETMQDIKAVTQEFNQLNSIFNQLKLGLIHGRLKSEDKKLIINDFRNKKLDILVATPVIEVGMDIPNAAIMMVENAERFGLAQLHQLRGRVGRNNQKSYCLIFSQNQPSLKRLKYLETNYSGLKLAELDLKLRGPGDLYGLKQHGFLQLKLASLTDIDLINLSRRAALGCQPLTWLLKKQLEKHKINFIAPN